MNFRELRHPVRTGLVTMAIATSSLLLTQASSTAQQIFYPSSQDPNAVMVTGMGMAKAAADSAELYFYLGSDGPFPAAVPPKSRKPPAKPPQPAVSEKSIVDALVAIGIPASAIRVDADRGAPIYGPPNARETLISVKLEKPTRQRVRQVVNIVRANAYKAGQSPRSTYAAYRSTNCSALEKAAYAAAVQEAKTKAGAIAESMGVTLVTTPSISEAFFGIFYPPCDPDKTFPFNPGSSRPNYLPYNPDSEPEVVLRKDIYATFRITPSK